MDIMASTTFTLRSTNSVAIAVAVGLMNITSAGLAATVDKQTAGVFALLLLIR